MRSLSETEALAVDVLEKLLWRQGKWTAAMAAADIASAGVGGSDMRMRSSNRGKETIARR